MAAGAILKRSKSSVARQLILVTVLFSVFLTVSTVSFQLYRDYQTDVNSIHARIEQIRSTQLESLASSIWIYDEKLIQVQLDGLLKLQDIEYLAIATDGEYAWSAGKQVSDNVVSAEFPLMHTSVGRQMHAGTLLVVASLDGVYSRVLEKGAEIFFSVGLLIFMVAGFLFIILQRLVTRHLISLADYARTLDADSLQRPLRLGKGGKDDAPINEFDDIARAIHEMHTDLRLTYDSLVEYKDRLEEMVTDRTLHLEQEISERKTAETAMRESEQRFRQIAEIATDVIWEMDAKLRYTYISDNFLRATGKTKADIIGKTRFDDLSEDELSDNAEFWDEHRKVLENRQPFRNLKVSMHTAGGEEIHYTVNGNPVFDEDGEFLGYRGATSNVTQQVLADNALRESEARLLEILATSPFGISIIARKDRQRLYANERYIEMFGFDQDHETHTEQVIASYVNKHQIEQYWEDFEQDGSLVERENLRCRPDGTMWWCLADWRPMSFSGQNSVVIWNYDISNRKEAEEELNIKSRIVSLLSETAAAANRSLDFNEALKSVLDTIRGHSGWALGHCYLVSEANTDLLIPTGIWSVDETEEYNDFINLTNKTEFGLGTGLPGRVLDTGKSVLIDELSNDENFMRAEGCKGTSIESAVAFPVLSDGHAVAVLEFFDQNIHKVDDSLIATLSQIGAQLGLVFERKKSQLALESAKDEADAANSAKSMFLATMSHEIRTPMNGVIGMIDLLRTTKLEHDQQSLVATVRESAFSLLNIINDILDFSKIEAGKLEIEEVKVSVRDILEGVTETLLPIVSKKQLHLHLFIDPDIPDAIVSDPVRLRQILFNLMGNATKFTTTTDKLQGEITIAAKVDTDETTGKSELTVAIADNGIGMAKDVVEGLFKPFYQAEAATTRKFGGTGLGLSICKTLSELMDGEITVTSELNHGSVFSLRMPLIEFDDENKIKEKSSLDGLRVLGAIDDAKTRDYTRIYLEHHGADIQIADSYQNAEDIFSERLKTKNLPDIILLGHSGSSATRDFAITRIRKLAGENNIRFVVLNADRSATPTGQLSDVVSVDCLPLKRSAFLSGIAVAAGRASPEIVIREALEVTVASTVPTIEEAENNNELVLVAEDNLTNQEVIRRQLHLLGYAVIITDDGQHALDVMKEHNFALLLTDCHMPIIDGYELTAAIRADEEKFSKPRLPIVAVTANALQGEDDNCIEAGMDDYLSKPVELQALAKLMKTWITRTIERADLDITREKHPESVKDHPGPDSHNSPVDRSVLAQYVGDDDDIQVELLKGYVDPAREIVKDIKLASENHLAADVKDHAHKIKSSTRSVGAIVLGDHFEALEEAGKAEDWDEINILMAGLDNVFDPVIDYILALGAEDVGADVPGPVDRSVLAQYVGDDDEIQVELLKGYLDPARQIIRDIHDAYGEKLPAAVKDHAHKIKSSTRSIGAIALADHFEAMETAGKLEDWEEIDRLVKNIDTMFCAVEDYINTL